MEVAVLQTFNALSVSSILLLIALGLAFSFGLMGVINMAHGEFIMIGAYTAYALQVLNTGAGGEAASDLVFLASIAAAFLVAGAAGFLLERLLVCRLYGRALDTLLATWGVGLVLQCQCRRMEPLLLQILRDDPQHILKWERVKWWEGEMGVDLFDLGIV